MDHISLVVSYWENSLVASCNSDSTSRAGAEGLVVGSTDTEVAGATFADHLTSDICHEDVSQFTMEDLQSAMKRTVEAIQGIDETCGSSGSSLNFAVTDGIRVIAVRHRTCLNEEPPSLYYAITVSDGVVESLWVASEPLDKEESKRIWTLLPKDSMLSYHSIEGTYTIDCLTEACERELQRRATVQETLHRISAGN